MSASRSPARTGSRMPVTAARRLEGVGARPHPRPRAPRPRLWAPRAAGSERIFQLDEPGLGGDFPALRARPGSRPVRVVLADDTVLLREGVARLLDDAGFRVVAQPAMRQAAAPRHQAPPNVANIDIRMPPRIPTRASAPPGIHNHHPVHAASSCSRSTSRPATRSSSSPGAGREGRLSPQGPPHRRRRARRRHPARLTRRLGDRSGGRQPARRQPAPRRARSPSSRPASARCCELMAKGRSTPAIAERLFVTLRAVEKHVDEHLREAAPPRRRLRAAAACSQCSPCSAAGEPPAASSASSVSESDGSASASTGRPAAFDAATVSVGRQHRAHSLQPAGQKPTHDPACRCHHRSASRPPTHTRSPSGPSQKSSTQENVSSTVEDSQPARPQKGHPAPRATASLHPPQASARCGRPSYHHQPAACHGPSKQSPPRRPPRAGSRPGFHLLGRNTFNPLSASSTHHPPASNSSSSSSGASAIPSPPPPSSLSLTLRPWGRRARRLCRRHGCYL